MFVVIGAILLSVGLSLGLAWSGIDAGVWELAQRQDRTWSIVWSVVPLVGGMIVPVGVPLLVERRAVVPVGVAVAVASVLKVLVGRVHPEAIEMEAYARSTSFFWLGGGVVEGWPSGHMLVNTALAVVMGRLGYSRWLWGGWASWVGIAVVSGVQGEVHWLSDAVAGGLIGYALGASRLWGWNTGSVKTSGLTSPSND